MARLQEACLIVTREQLCEIIEMLIQLGDLSENSQFVYLNFVQTKLGHEVFKNSGMFPKIITSISSSMVIPYRDSKLVLPTSHISFPKMQELETFTKNCQETMSTYVKQNLSNLIEIRVYGEKF